MPHEPSGSCSPIQQACSKRCSACEQVKPVADLATPAGRSSSCRDCQGAVSRLASHRRAAAMRLLIAAHLEEWVGLLGLVRAHRQLGTNWPKRGGRYAV